MLCYYSCLVNYYLLITIGKPNQSGNSSQQKQPNQRHKSPTKHKGHATLKRPLYDNAKLQAPDGELLCVCDSRKAAWYVTKGLGKFRFTFDTLFQDEKYFCDNLLHDML